MEQAITLDRKSFVIQIIPVMLCFFAMGFVDLVDTASNYVQKDLGLTDSEANLFPSLVFFWFLIFSVPTGMLMNKIGRKKTVLISLVITAVSLIIPIFGDSYAAMLAAFSLLGIGNAVMQTSLNPLVTNLISGDKLASTLTDLAAAFGPQRRISLCRELTKLHEEVRRTTLGEAAAWYEENPPKGEFVLVVEGGCPPAEDSATLEDGLARLLALQGQGCSLKDAARQVAAELGLPRKALYDRAVSSKKDE